MAGTARGNAAKTQAAPLAGLPASRRRCPPPVAVLPAPAPRFPITSRAFYDLYGTHRIPGAARGACRNVGLAPPNFAGHVRARTVSRGRSPAIRTTPAILLASNSGTAGPITNSISSRANERVSCANSPRRLTARQASAFLTSRISKGQRPLAHLLASTALRLPAQRGKRADGKSGARRPRRAARPSWASGPRKPNISSASE